LWLIICSSSFTTHRFLSEIDSDGLWDVLAQCSLGELVVKEKNNGGSNSAPDAEYYILQPGSKLWNMHDLTTIEIATSNGWASMTSALARLLPQCPNLQALKLSGSGIITNSGLNDLHGINIRSLDLDRWTLEGDGEGFLRFLTTLPKLEKLRLEQCDPESGWKDERAIEQINLPGLKDVEISHADLLKRVLLRSRPKAVRNLACARGEGLPPSPSPGYYLPLDEIVRNCESLRELQLWLTGGLRFDLKDIVQLLKAVPLSVERLAIRMRHRSIELMDMNHRDLSQNIIKAISRLVNLERLILPWQFVICEEDKQDFYHGQDRLFHLEARATDLLSRFTNAKLDYVFFQGNGKMDGVTPIDRLSFDENDGYQERWIVRITRVPLAEEYQSRRPMPPPHRRQWSLRHGTCFPDTSHGRLQQQGVLIRAEVMSTNCLCKQCWCEDNMGRSPACIGM
jgi:hypothetical protein